jgi:predicted nucleotidyltransferase
MRLTEISSASRKTIKKLQKLYFSFIINYSNYIELIELINQCKLSEDIDLIREATIIDDKVIEELLRILKE